MTQHRACCCGPDEQCWYFGTPCDCDPDAPVPIYIPCDATPLVEIGTVVAINNYCYTIIGQVTEQPTPVFTSYTIHDTCQLCCDATQGTVQACCLPDGSCVEVLPDECVALGGTPQGRNTVCEDVSCPGEGGSLCGGTIINSPPFATTQCQCAATSLGFAISSIQLVGVPNVGNDGLSGASLSGIIYRCYFDPTGTPGSPGQPTDYCCYTSTCTPDNFSIGGGAGATCVWPFFTGCVDPDTIWLCPNDPNACQVYNSLWHVDHNASSPCDLTFIDCTEPGTTCFDVAQGPGCTFYVERGPFIVVRQVSLRCYDDNGQTKWEAAVSLSGGYERTTGGCQLYSTFSCAKEQFVESCPQGLSFAFDCPVTPTGSLVFNVSFT